MFTLADGGKEQGEGGGGTAMTGPQVALHGHPPEPPHLETLRCSSGEEAREALWGTKT